MVDVVSNVVANGDKITEGLKFMVLGMGTVFSFLILMIIAMNLQAYIINKFFPEPVATPPKASSSNTNKNAKIAAISAAIMHHKQSNS